jgi:flavodoxin
MKTLVAYFSQTGNTRRVAEAIYEIVTGEKEIKTLDQLQTLEGYDLTFIGFPIIGFGPAPQAKEFLGKYANGVKVALFITHAAPEDEEGLGTWLDKCREAAASANLVGTFDCMGELSEQIADYLIKSNDPVLKAFGERRGETLGQPDATRLHRAREFARGVIEKVTER